MVLGESGLMAVCPNYELAGPCARFGPARLAQRRSVVAVLGRGTGPAARALPTRADLRSLDEHIAERLDALAARLDRMLDV